MSNPATEPILARLKTSLTPEEWSIVWRLRDVPEGRLRADLLSLFDELLAFASEPHCAETQADGVPCAGAHTACEECERVTSCLSRLRERLRSF